MNMIHRNEISDIRSAHPFMYMVLEEYDLGNHEAMRQQFPETYLMARQRGYISKASGSRSLTERGRYFLDQRKK